MCERSACGPVSAPGTTLGTDTEGGPRHGAEDLGHPGDAGRVRPAGPPRDGGGHQRGQPVAGQPAGAQDEGLHRPDVHRLGRGADHRDVPSRGSQLPHPPRHDGGHLAPRPDLAQRPRSAGRPAHGGFARRRAGEGQLLAGQGAAHDAGVRRACRGAGRAAGAPRAAQADARGGGTLRPGAQAPAAVPAHPDRPHHRTRLGRDERCHPQRDAAVAGRGVRGPQRRHPGHPGGAAGAGRPPGPGRAPGRRCHRHRPRRRQHGGPAAVLQRGPGARGARRHHPRRVRDRPRGGPPPAGRGRGPARLHPHGRGQADRAGRRRGADGHPAGPCLVGRCPGPVPHRGVAGTGGRAQPARARAAADHADGPRAGNRHAAGPGLAGPVRSRGAGGCGGDALAHPGAQPLAAQHAGPRLRGRPDGIRRRRPQHGPGGDRRSGVRPAGGRSAVRPRAGDRTGPAR